MPAGIYDDLAPPPASETSAQAAPAEQYHPAPAPVAAPAASAPPTAYHQTPQYASYPSSASAPQAAAPAPASAHADVPNPTPKAIPTLDSWDNPPPSAPSHQQPAPTSNYSTGPGGVAPKYASRCCFSLLERWLNRDLLLVAGCLWVVWVGRRQTRASSISSVASVSWWTQM